MNDSRYYDLIGKYLSGEISDQEREGLMSWANQREENRRLFEELRILWESSEELEETFESTTEQGWEGLERKMAARSSGKSGRRAPFQTALRIAAALLVLLAALWWIWPGNDRVEMEILTTLAGETTELQLPDGSTVVLNESSTLQYPLDFGERRIELTGEAFFEVERDEKNPFRILAGGTITEVLGTSFYIRAYPEEEVELTVSSGKVAFRDEEKKQEELVLEKGEKAVYKPEKKQLERQDKVNENLLAWHTGAFHFSATPLSEVLPALERYFQVTFELSTPNLMNCRLSGNFQQPELEEMLSILEIALELTTKREEGGQILLQGEGC